MSIKEQTEKISIEFASEIDIGNNHGIVFNVRYYFDETMEKYVANIKKGNTDYGPMPFEVLCDIVDHIRSKTSKNTVSTGKTVVVSGPKSSLPLPAVVPSKVESAPVTDTTKEPVQISSFSKKEQIIKQAEEIEVSSGEESGVVEEHEDVAELKEEVGRNAELSPEEGEADNNEEVDIFEERKKAAEIKKEVPKEAKFKRKE